MSWIRSTTEGAVAVALRPEAPAPAPRPPAPRATPALEVDAAQLPAAPAAPAAPPAPAAARPLAATDLSAAAARSLGALDERAGYTQWALTRVVHDDWLLLHSAGDGIALPTGSRLALLDTICGTVLDPAQATSATATGDLASVPDARLRELAAGFGIRSYAGSLVRSPAGAVLGTLCAFAADPVRRDSRLLPLVEAHSFALGESMAREIAGMHDARDADRDEALGSADDLTALPDRRGWGLMLAREEQRARRLGEPSGVVVVDLAGLRTVRSVRRAIAAVAEATGPRTSLARLGGRQLGLLCGGASPEDVAATAEAVLSQLRAVRVSATAGWAMRRGSEGLDHAWWRAERDALASRRLPGA